MKKSVLTCLVALPSLAAAQESSVQILGGVDKTEVRAGGKTDTFYRLDPGGAALKVRAVGPTFLVVRLRVQEGPFGKASGRVYVERDAQTRSDNIFTVDNDKEAFAVGKGLSLEKHLLVEVPEGEHSYLVSAPAGAMMVVVKVLKSPKKVVEWVAAPERPIPAPPKVAAAEEPELEPLVKEEGEKAPEPEEETTPAETPGEYDEAAGRKPIWVSVAGRLGALIPAGRLNDVKLAATDSLRDAAAGKLGLFDHRGATLPFSVQATYRIPWPLFAPKPPPAEEGKPAPGAPPRNPWLDRAFAVGVESGIYPLFGKGRREMPNDPDFPVTDYRWEMLSIPIFAGLSYRPALPALFKWWPLKLRLAPEAGFAAVFTSITSYYKVGAAPEVQEPAQSGWALGFYLGLEGAFPVGPGDIVANVRYVNARTDLAFQKIYADPPQPWNQGLGDVQGTNVLAGYRYMF
jgi:hypothetical protein